MTLSSALSNALSGLRTSAFAADVVGTNLANSLNENFGRRQVELGQRGIGVQGGVEIVAINRATNQVANTDWRKANGAEQALNAKIYASERVSRVIGDPSSDNSLTSALTNLESSLLSASSRPDLIHRLEGVGYALSEVVSKINDTGDEIQSRRKAADDGITTAVFEINQTLEGIEKNNRQIATARQGGTNISDYLDQRDTLLDKLSEFVDVQVFQRENNTIALYSTGGIALLDPEASTFEFQPASVVTADLNVGNGTLATVTVNGQAIDSSRLKGGVLESYFNIRDHDMVDAQNELDAFAFDLAERLNDPSVDPSLSGVTPGLLTDGGGVVDHVNLVGLASRLQLNTSVDPNTGGNASLIRDGLYAVGSPNPGAATILNNMSSALSAQAVASFGQFTGLSKSSNQFAAQLASSYFSLEAKLESQHVALQAEKNLYAELKYANSVDTDTELQKLMVIEQAYGANAQVIRAIDEMMDTVLGLT